jgi:hypothetical protein
MGTARSGGLATIGAYQVATIDSYDVFIAKFDTSGVLKWATYYGGGKDEQPCHGAMDGTSFIYITGQTLSQSGISTAGAYQTTYGGSSGGDQFLAKFDSTGALQWATYYGGSGGDGGDGIAIDQSGDIYTTGATNSTSGIATAGAHQSVYGGGLWSDVYLVKFNSSGNRLWATYFGGTGDESPTAPVCDSNGNIYFSGRTTSTTAIATPGAFQTVKGVDFDAFLVKFSSAGTLLGATYFGGNAYDWGLDIEIDRSDHVLIVGLTTSSSGIATTGAHQPTFGGVADGFMVKFDGISSRLWCTYYGGNDNDNIQGLTLDAAENIYLTGLAQSTTAIATPGSYQPTYMGGRDGFLVQFNSAGVRQWGTYIGSPGADWGLDVVSDNMGGIYNSGYIAAGNTGFATPGAYQTLHGGGEDGYLAKFSFCVPPSPGTINGSSSLCIGASSNLTSTVAGGTWTSSNSGIATVNSTGTITGIAAGSANIIYTITDSCGTSSALHAVTVGNTTATITPGGPTAFCLGDSVTLTSSNATAYTWSTGEITQSIMVSQAGSYNVTVANTSGCLDTSASVAVTINPLPLASVNPAVPLSICTGSGTTLTSSGAASYAWSNGATTQSINVSQAGNYNVVITDSNGCGSAPSAGVQVSLYPAPVATITANGPTIFCAGDSVELTAAINQNYTWSTGAATRSIVVRQSGAYFVNVTDINGCTATSATITITVTPPPAVTITASGSTALCQGDSVTLTASSGNTYLWSNGATGQNITTGQTGSYSVTVTNGSCIGISSAVNVTVNPPPVAAITMSGPTTFCQGNNVILTADAASNYHWSNGATTQSISVTQTGNYSLTVANGSCSANSSPVSVTVNTAPAATITTSGPTALCPGDSVTLTTGAANGYLWNTGATSQTIMVTLPGNYQVMITGANGCSDTSATVIVTTNTLPDTMLTISGPTEFCLGDSVTLTASAGYSYLWNNGAVTQSIVVTQSGEYTVKLIGACSSSSQHITVTVNPLPQPDITQSGLELSTTAIGSYQWYYNGALIANAEQSFYVATEP